MYFKAKTNRIVRDCTWIYMLSRIEFSPLFLISLLKWILVQTSNAGLLECFNELRGSGTQGGTEGIVGCIQ